MQKNLLVLGFLVILITSFISGCQEQEAVKTSNLEKIKFESELVELIYSNITKHIDGEEVLRAEVEYLFKNIAGRDINLTVFVEFYNINNELLYTGGPKYINLLDGWTEHGISPTNTISYSGKRADEVDYVKIIASE